MAWAMCASGMEDAAGSGDAADYLGSFIRLGLPHSPRPTATRYTHARIAAVPLLGDDDFFFTRPPSLCTLLGVTVQCPVFQFFSNPMTNLTLLRLLSEYGKRET